MSSWPLVKYVDSPSTTATVRYDFNDQAATPVKKVTEFDPGVPTLEGDPDAVGQQWGFRSPSIVHVIKGTKAQAMAALSLVSREQLRRTNWLLFQPAAAQQPVWFKTYRTGYQPITLAQVWVRTSDGGQVALPDTWKITVPVVADAFAYGARVAIATATVTQAPSGTNPMRLVLPAIKGDAPTALRVAVRPASGNSASGGSEWLIGCISGSASMQDPVMNIGTADGFTPGVDGAAVTTGDATFFSSDYRTLTMPGTNQSKLTSGTLPVTARGLYKVLVRGEFSAGVTYLFALSQLTNTPVKRAVTVPAAGAHQGWVDIGDYSIPFGGGRLPEDQPLTDSAQGVVLQATSSAAGTVKIDALKFIPIDGPTVSRATLLRARFPTTGFVFTNAFFGMFDGDDEISWGVAAAGGAFGSGAIRLMGQYPVADPAAAQNLLIVMTIGRGDTVGSAPYVTTPTAQCTVDVSYYPRYLYVGDGT
jgi:hypothetical protein